MSRRGALVALASMSLAACGPFLEGECDEEETAHAVGVAVEHTESLRAMTRNLDIGVELSASLAVPTEQIPVAVALAFQQLVASDFPTRAHEIALEIKAASPQLIGLQEAELIRVQSPGDSLGSSPTAATEVFADYLGILLAELDQLGLCYRVAVVGEQTDLELPAALPGQPGYQDVRVTDRDAILARCDVEIANAEAHHFVHDLVVPIGDTGLTAEIFRGWQEVDARIGQRAFHFANTHLEPVSLPEIALLQVAQAEELVVAMADETLPVVLVGDFNSAADGSTTPTYGLMLAGGFADAWWLARGGERGYTCCQEDLRERASTLSQRIDFVFVRDLFDAWLWRHGGVSAFLVGDRIPRGFDTWPSDHAGVVADLRIFSRPLLAWLESQTEPRRCGHHPGIRR